MIYTQVNKKKLVLQFKIFFLTSDVSFLSLFRKVLVSSIKGQVWHLDLQQGKLLLSEDGSHLILVLTK